MIFKQIRPLIFSRLELIIGDENIEDVEVNDPAIDIYDYYEVIGIRAGVNYFDSWKDYESRVIISLKPTITSFYEKAAASKAREACEYGCSCKK